MGISIALKSNLFDSFKYLIATGNNLKEKTLCRCNDLKRLPDSIGNEKEGIWQVSFWCSILHTTWHYWRKENLQSLRLDLQGTMAALLLWESGKGGECSWSCCEGIRGRVWASSDVPQNAIDALLDYFHDGPSQRASLGAASRFETLWLLWVWIHKRNNLLGEY